MDLLSFVCLQSVPTPVILVLWLRELFKVLWLLFTSLLACAEHGLVLSGDTLSYLIQTGQMLSAETWVCRKFSPCRGAFSSCETAGPRQIR